MAIVLPMVIIKYRLRWLEPTLSYDLVQHAATFTTDNFKGEG